MSKPVIVLNELTKSYGKHRGIENISFTVEQGEVFGLLAPMEQENLPQSVL